MEQTLRHMGRTFRRLRQESGLTQRAFAERLNVHPSYIGPLERGARQPSLSLLLDVAAQFDISIHDFFPRARGTTGAVSAHLQELENLLIGQPEHVQHAIIDIAIAAHDLATARLRSE
jgi:transcriptional regulator with XRE-family HTH domain